MFFKSEKFEYLIAGLGNPGKEYEATRHNAGFMAIDALLKDSEIVLNKHKFESEFATASLEGKKVIILKPLTYMNNSGEAIGAISKFYKIPPEKCIIIFDEISLDVGTIRIRRKGSAGGHNGIKSIISHLNSEDFPRIKIGVGEKPDKDYDLKDWVLGNIPKVQKEEFDKACSNAAKAVKEILKNSIDSAMNKFSK